jgi:twitching motility protein PilT
MIPEAIAEGAYYGMQTFDQALLGHLKDGRINMDEALSMATSPHDFKLMAASGGASSSSLENVEQESEAVF